MSYLTIENFKFGLDTRRSELTSQAGVLAVCENGHVNQGGEIDKRLGFIGVGNLGILDSNNDTGTFGLEPISGTIVTFGSAVRAASATQSQPTIAAMPAGFTYQQLQHPYVTDGGTYDRTKYRLTKVVSSCTFKGNTFVVATFADGNTFTYYNASIVRESSDGKVYGAAITSTIISDIRNQLQRAFLPFGYSLTFDVGGQFDSFVVANNTSNMLFGAPGTTLFTPIFGGVSAAGAIGGYKAGGNGTGVGGPSQATYTVVGNASFNYRFEVPTAPQGKQYVTITGTPANVVNWAVSDNNTASLIATSINGNTATTGFSASATGNVVTVSAPVPTTIGNNNYGTMVVVVFNGSTFSNVNSAFSTGYSNGTTNGAYGQSELIGIGGTWVTGDTWSINIVPASGVINSFTVGRGTFGGLPYGQCYPVGGGSGSGGPGGRIFLACGSQFNYSAIDNPTGWQTPQDVGAGSISFVNNFQGQDVVSAFSLYQGRLAVFGLYSIQIWIPNADPAQFQITQTLTNIGTDAPLSVVGFGELDVFFRGQSGVRSLRVRDSSLNAFVTDVGSPIDSQLTANTDAQRQAACSVLEPNQHRYWIHENGVIYVLSYFPTLKISAWSTYNPTFDTNSVVAVGNYNSSGLVNIDSLLTSGHTYIWQPNGHETDLVIDGVSYKGFKTFTFTAQAITARGTPLATCTAVLTDHVQTAFTPEKFIIYNGQVYVRATSGNVFAFGGVNGDTYDFSVLTVETPWLDAKKAATRKGSRSIDQIVSGGSWVFSGSMDYRTGVSTIKTLKPISTVSSPDQGVLPFTAEGTHVKLRAQTMDNVAATLSAFMWHYKDEGEKK